MAVLPGEGLFSFSTPTLHKLRLLIAIWYFIHGFVCFHLSSQLECTLHEYYLPISVESPAQFLPHNICLMRFSL